MYIYIYIDIYSIYNTRIIIYICMCVLYVCISATMRELVDLYYLWMVYGLTASLLITHKTLMGCLMGLAFTREFGKINRRIFLYQS